LERKDLLSPAGSPEEEREKTFAAAREEALITASGRDRGFESV